MLLIHTAGCLHFSNFSCSLFLHLPFHHCFSLIYLPVSFPPSFLLFTPFSLSFLTLFSHSPHFLHLCFFLPASLSLLAFNTIPTLLTPFFLSSIPPSLASSRFSQLLSEQHISVFFRSEVRGFSVTCELKQHRLLASPLIC